VAFVERRIDFNRAGRKKQSARQCREPNARIEIRA
jgi:hypothetical protein